MKTFTLSWGQHHIKLGQSTRIMGILNVTPDSFSDGGKFIKCDAAVAHARKMVEEGADIIDIGGESTRPFAEPVSADVESRRVVPVIEQLAKRIPIPISIDTTKASVARQAIDAGASIINDISALRFDPEMADVAAEYGVPVILMHMKGAPQTMQEAPAYEDPVNEINAFLKDAITRAEQKGIPRSRIIADPGIGFGKTIDHNLLLIKHLDVFKSLTVPILCGSSRKSFIRGILKGKSYKNTMPNLPALETGTQAVIAAAVLHGAHIVRVHDVASTYVTIKIVDAIKNM